MHGLWQDLREVARALGRAPQCAALCVAVLAIGVGLATAVFTAFYAIVMRPLPVLDAERVVVGWGVNTGQSINHVPLYASQWRRLADTIRSLEATAAVDYNGAWPWVVRDGGTTYPARRGLVSGNFFDVLGARAHLGRLLNPADDRIGSEPVGVLAYGFWQRQFGGDASIIGRRLTLHATGISYRIVGVASRGLDYPTGTELWVPLMPTTTYAPADTSSALVDVVGRLRAGSTPAEAAAELSTFLANEPGTTARQSRGTVATLPQLVTGDVQREFALFGIAVLLLLLVGCMNVGGLMMMRGTQQRRAVALRIALGASGRRVLRWHFVEGVVLATAGWVLGVAIAHMSLALLVHYGPGQLPRLEEIQLDRLALGVAALLGAVTAVLCAMAPAIMAARVDPATLLRTGGSGVSASRGTLRAREWLVIGQVAGAVVVLSAAALVINSLRELQRAKLGYEDANVMIVDLAWDFTRITTPAQSLATYDALIPRVEAIPGVEHASALMLTPFTGTAGWDVVFVAGDRPLETQRGNPYLNMEVVSPSYFDVFRMPPKQGRLIQTGDREGTERVVVLSEGAARALWPRESALGKRLSLSSEASRSSQKQWTVVGVVADTRYRDYLSPRPTVYFPHHQPPFELATTMLAVRASGDPLASLPAIRAALREVEPSVMVGQATTMRAHLDRPLARPRFNSLLLAVFALSSAVMAAAGLYAVLAFSVRMRAREFAIRSAVGAGPRALRGLVIQSAWPLVVAGITIGLLVTAAGQRMVQGMLYGVTPLDPASLSLGVLAFLGVAGVAVLGPSRWAARTSAEELRRLE